MQDRFFISYLLRAGYYTIQYYTRTRRSSIIFMLVVAGHFGLVTASFLFATNVSIILYNLSIYFLIFMFNVSLNYWYFYRSLVDNDSSISFWSSFKWAFKRSVFVDLTEFKREERFNKNLKRNMTDGRVFAVYVPFLNYQLHDGFENLDKTAEFITTYYFVFDNSNELLKFSLLKELILHE